MAPGDALRSARRPAAGGSGDSFVGWAAIGAAASAVLAWAACCVLPLALSLAGLGLGATAWIAGQRTWLTLAAATAIGLGWWLTWRRARACWKDGTCPPPSRFTVGLLNVATALILAALVWRPAIEPWLLTLLRAARG
ncbi:MAG: MFS transporter permease [Phenylobacterium sp.]|uniref:MFS transporter permease n=1 Tax=Phenylobacterium sp. TaxID=1871053 RepID=UPI0027339708|nr:MFS transporter permease [Phenylobacterium sp.]MDP3747880.1 MFS transporter permease [Phenylobacterium sp.]